MDGGSTTALPPSTQKGRVGGERSNFGETLLHLRSILTSGHSWAIVQESNPTKSVGLNQRE